MPAIPSPALGVGHMRGNGARKSLGDLPPERIAIALVFEASGVGNKPEPVAAVRGANGASWDAIPPSIIPERGQVSENVSKSSTKERCDVFHDNVSGSKLANQSCIVSPKAGTFAGQSSASSGQANVLAGEAAADRIDMPDHLSGQSRHIIEARDVGPMGRQQMPTRSCDLAEGHGLESRPLQAEREAADAGEKVQQSHSAHSARIPEPVFCLFSTIAGRAHCMSSMSRCVFSGGPAVTQ